MLGIGIDDMFVIVQCRNTLSEKEKSLPVVERIGCSMAHAGVAITITSITDFIAFGVGATTSLPALRSFCVYASIGILVIFFFQSTWFTALLAIDEQRVEGKRNGCFCCVVHHTFSVTTESSSDKMTNIFKCFSQQLVKLPSKVDIICSQGLHTYFRLL